MAAIVLLAYKAALNEIPRPPLIVHTHVRHAFAKIGVHAQAEVTRLVTQLSLLEP